MTLANVVWIPFSIRDVPVSQRNAMFKSWCKLVMDNIAALGAKAVLAYEEEGEAGPAAAERNIQGAQVWIEANGVSLKYNVGVPYNDMLANDFPKQGSDIRRNDAAWYAGSLIARVQYYQDWPPSLGYGLLPRPVSPDITV